MLNNGKKFFLLAASVIFLNACVKKIPVNQPGQNKLYQGRLENMLANFEARSNNINTLKTLYYVNTEYGKKKDRFRQVYLYNKPDKLRLEILPTTSTYAMGLLIANGKQAKFMEQDKTTESDSVEDLLYDIVRFRGSINDLISLLAGLIPEKYLNSELSAYEASNSSVQVFSNDKRYNALVDADKSEIQSIQLVNESLTRVIMTVSYSDYSDYQGTPMPGFLRIFLPKEDIHISLKLNHFEINSSISPEKFF